MTDPNDIADREVVLAELESDEQLAADLLANEEAVAELYDALHPFEPGWAFLP